MTFPFDAVLVLSYGGPRQPEDVLPFMRNATRGRGIPDERLLEVSEHYLMFGGASPINERNDELMDALRAELSRRGVDVPVVIGNRNWDPYVTDALAQLAAGGARRVVVLATSAYASYSSCRQYREDLAAALADTGLEFDLVKVGPFAETDGFVAANADAVRDALAELPGARVLFVSHSIPTAMDAASGPGGDNTYSAQHRRVAQAVASEVGLADDAWEMAWCSRSGAPHIPWLEPDVNDRLAELAADGVSSVVTVPYGFVNDHMEVVYDLDTEARATASGLGLGYVRAATVGVHPAFIGMLAVALTDPQPGSVGGLATCHATCCLLGRPGAPVLPTACAAD
ncbi:ferrochelatase [Propioniciclava sp. MC1595]|uniref:ferrochelatase n=1 Tax=Propioniciclava sp. MC1595 TaxID=2760308 RepID=UPI001FB7B2FA|nr:ferrochelatase [Propioniciclava sp. MC1595]